MIVPVVPAFGTVLQSTGGTAAGTVTFLLSAGVVAAQAAGMAMSFSKADEPARAAIVPVYNLYVWLKVAGRPAWWLLLWILPLLTIIPQHHGARRHGEKFGKGTGFGIGLMFLPFVFFPILGFGDATYRGQAV